MQVVLINPIFSPDNGQGYVNLRLAAFLASAGVPTHLIGSVPPEEWRSLPGISHTPLSIPKRLPALLRYRWIPWARYTGHASVPLASRTRWLLPMGTRSTRPMT